MAGSRCPIAKSVRGYGPRRPCGADDTGSGYRKSEDAELLEDHSILIERDVA
jgi:hypothetical protein